MKRSSADTPQASENLAEKKSAEKIAAEHLLRRQGGEPLSDAELLASHPEIREELSVELAKQQLVKAAIAEAQKSNPVSTPGAGGGNADTVEAGSTAGAFPTEVACPNCRQSVPISTLNERAATTRCQGCGEQFALIQAEPQSRAGEQVAHFQLVEPIGAGGFGSVWKAVDTRLDRVVALKLPRALAIAGSESELFMREARTAAQLQHPNIVRVHEVGSDNGTLFIASDLIAGESLSQQMAERQHTFRESASLVAKVARAMHYAHGQGIVHRDIKPQNILVDSQGEPFVTDFGLARRASVEVTMTTDGAIMGTPVYMSPEQASGKGHEADARSDVYALGVTLYQLLTGELPFRGSAASVVRQVIDDEPPRPRQLNSHIPRDLETICLKSLEKTAGRRYQTAAALAEDLDRWINRQPIHARPIGRMGRLVRWGQRKPMVAGLLTTLLLVGSIGTAAVMWQWRKAEGALAAAQVEQLRADQNLENAWGAINEFLVEVTEMEFANAPRVGAARESLLKRATDYLEQVARSNSNDPQSRLYAASAFYRLGRVRATHGEIDQGMQALARGLEICDSLQRERFADDSVEHTKALLLISRGAVSAFFSRGQIELDAEADFRAARNLLDKLLENDAENTQYRGARADAIAKLGALLLIKQKPQAVTVLREATDAWQSVIDVQPENAQAIENQARCYLDVSQAMVKAGNADEAVKEARQGLRCVEQALAMAPDTASIRGQLPTACSIVSFAEYESGNLTAAIDTIQRGIEARKQLAIDFPEFRHNYEQLASLYMRLSQYYVEDERFEEAIASAERATTQLDKLTSEVADAVEITATYAQALAVLGDVNVAAKHYESAIDAFRRALNLQLPTKANRNMTSILAHAECGQAEALVGLNRPSEGLDAARRSIALAESAMESAQPLETRLVDVKARTVLLFALLRLGQSDAIENEIESGLLKAHDLSSLDSESATNFAIYYVLAAAEALHATGQHTRSVDLLTSAPVAMQVAGNEQASMTVPKLLGEAYRRYGSSDQLQQWKQRQQDRTQNQPSEQSFD